MWFSNWVWFKSSRNVRRPHVNDPADMGVEIGLDASLDSMLPPLFNFAVDRGQGQTTTVLPLGTDLRSHHHKPSR